MFGWVGTDLYVMRYGLWYPALFSRAFGVVVRRMRFKFVRNYFYVLASVCLLLNFVGTLNVLRVHPSDWYRMARLPVLERSSAAFGLYFGDRYEKALKKIPKGEPLGYLTYNDLHTYPLYGPDFSRKIYYIPIDEGTDIVKAMKEKGVRFLFLCNVQGPAVRQIDKTVQAGKLKEIEVGLYVREI